MLKLYFGNQLVTIIRWKADFLQGPGSCPHPRGTGNCFRNEKALTRRVHEIEVMYSLAFPRANSNNGDEMLSQAQSSDSILRASRYNFPAEGGIYLVWN